jgi:hypothetical protein
MSNKLIDFLIKLGENLSLQREYGKDPEKVMSEHGLSAEDKAAILSGDEQLILGEEYRKDERILYKLILRVPKPGGRKAPRKK